MISLKTCRLFEYSKHKMFSEEDSVESRSARIKEVLEKLNFD